MLLSLTFDQFIIFYVPKPLFTDAKFWDILNIFKSSHSMLLVCLMIISSIIAPFLWMICQLFFLSHSASSEISLGENISNTTEVQTKGWTILTSEISTFWNSMLSREKISIYNSFPLFFTKFSMSIVYINAILMVATSNVIFAIGGDFSPDGTGQNNKHVDYIYAHVFSATRGGLLAYSLGINFGILTFMIVRAQFTQRCEYMSTCASVCDDSSNESENRIGPETNSKSILSPPPMAFRMTPNYEELRDQNNQSDLSLSLNGSMEQDFREELSAPLIRRLRREVEDHPLEISQDRSDVNTLDEVELPNTNIGCKLNWRSIVAFESCLIASILALPLVTEPLFKLEYAGILSPVFDESIYESRSFTLVDLVTTITSKSGKGVFPFLMSALLWTNVVIIPFASVTCCFIALLFKTFAKERISSKFTAFAAWLHPLNHFTPFALSVFATAASLTQVSNFLFDDTVFCSIVNELVQSSGNQGGKCLEISASMQPGLLYLVLHTFALDIFLHIGQEIQ